MRFHTPQIHSSDDKCVNSVELEVTFFMFQVNDRSSGDHRLFITDDDIGQVGTATVDLVTALMSAILIAPFLRHLLRIPKLSREIMQFQDGAKQPKKKHPKRSAAGRPIAGISYQIWRPSSTPSWDNDDHHRPLCRPTPNNLIQEIKESTDLTNKRSALRSLHLTWLIILCRQEWQTINMYTLIRQHLAITSAGHEVPLRMGTRLVFGGLLPPHPIWYGVFSDAESRCWESFISSNIKVVQQKTKKNVKPWFGRWLAVLDPKQEAYLDSSGCFFVLGSSYNRNLLTTTV